MGIFVFKLGGERRIRYKKIKGLIELCRKITKITTLLKLFVETRVLPLFVNLSNYTYFIRVSIGTLEKVLILLIFWQRNIRKLY